MTRILIAGFQHETNTFAPSRADWAAFTSGEGLPAFVRGQRMLDELGAVDLPIAGFIDHARTRHWSLVPSCWAGATPSSYVTEDAFERIVGSIVEDLHAAAAGSIDAIYLDLHGAAVAEHVDDCEGELLARLRSIVGPKLPIVASLDLHANVTARMLEAADALVAYRSYPHVDMAETGARAGELLARRLAAGQREPLHWQRLPFLIPLNAQSTTLTPAREIYDELATLDRRHGTVCSFAMGFPAADFDECGAVVWSHGAQAAASAERLFALAARAETWRSDALSARDAVARALQLAAGAARPVVLADTQDNPGAGGDGNTTGMLHALLAQGAGRAYPGQVALGLLVDAQAARIAHDAGVGAEVELTLGRAVPTFSGQASDPPLRGRFTVRALSDGEVTLRGPMMTGVRLHLGRCAALEIDGVRIAVSSGKAQLMDRAQLRAVGIHAEQMRIVVVKSSNHFRADFEPIAQQVLIAKAAGPMAADPGDLPWRKLAPAMRRRP